MGSRLEKLEQRIEAAFVEKTRRSKELNQRARSALPGGDTRSTVHYFPYPVYMARGRGCRLDDHDGHEYLDFLNNYTSLIHGHAHPRLVEAAGKAMEKGTVFGAPAEIQFIHAEHLCGRVPGLESVRYCNSGTEATMFALRAARAFTGRDVILKMDGGYHGTHDLAEINVTADLETEGAPRTRLEPGVPACLAEGVLVVPFNDLEAVEGLLSKRGGEIAAVVVEPIMGAGGLINPRPGYLEGLRRLTQRFQVLLIFDEVISFRLAWGGVQAREGIRPDLTALGKIIGGGFPVGAFGGRAEIMALFDPARPGRLGHGGTFNGNNVTLAAGLAALELYDRPAVDRLNALGDRLRLGLEEALESAGLKGRITGEGSLLGLHWGDEPPLNAREAGLGAREYRRLFRLVHLQLVNRGIHSAPRGMYVVSTPMTEKEVGVLVEVFGETLDLVKPAVAETWPGLVKG